MARLRDSPDDLFALCGAAADSFGIPESAFVEKDFWVVELLRSVVRPLELEPVNDTPCSATAIFKGGTSLSKAFNLIKRFSEDVDILVECSGYGASAREKRVLWPICARVADDLGLSGEQIVKLNYKTGFTRNVDYMYNRLIDSPAIRPGVRLEMGIRGGTMPGTQRRTVNSYIAEYIASDSLEANYDELAPVEVDVIAPVRTLAEKLALVHHAGKVAEAGNTTLLIAAGRHYYDIYQLLGDDEVIGALSTPGQTIAVLSADVDSRSAEFGWDSTPRPEDGYASSPAFRPTGAIREAAVAGYSNALNLVWGDRPSFDQCLDSIAEAHKIL
jgi:hypothetical protein